jgi:hypothetical protein
MALAGAEDLAPARAALVSGTYQITASNFGPAAPYDPVSFTVKLTFDDSVDHI